MLEAVRYVVPLREGGSLPAIIEAEDERLFVVKFRGAGQGARALLAEWIVGRLAHRMGLPVPDLAFVHLAESFGRTERDPEIQDILKGSRGLNVGLEYLDGAFGYDPLVAADLVPPDLAARVVVFDAFVTNIDRTPRNPNLLVWDRRLWLIDHGAALYVHHDWSGLTDARLQTPFAPIKEHVLLPRAGDLRAAEADLVAALTASVFEEVLAEVPEALFMDAPEGTTPPFPSAEANRAAYLDYLTRRIGGPRAFVDEAVRAQEAQRQAPRRSLDYRR